MTDRAALAATAADFARVFYAAAASLAIALACVLLLEEKPLRAGMVDAAGWAALSRLGRSRNWHNAAVIVPPVSI